MVKIPSCTHTNISKNWASASQGDRKVTQVATSRMPTITIAEVVGSYSGK
jgi:hypothetical protein